MKYVVLLIAAALLSPSTTTAQRPKNAKKSKKEVVVEENPLVTQMLSATQRVLFIDSMVVNKDDFYAHIPLSRECGRLLQDGDLGQYTNELGDHRLQALYHPDDTTAYLAVSDLIGGEWTEPVAVEGLGTDEANHPYLMPDGTTLYFAQKGEKSIGGYDIFVTRYNAANGTFLRPENLGMPFASEANDLLYVIDEQRQLGYFVTDRRQPEGKVCIYVFIPSASRHVYQSEAYTPGQLRSLAAINSIADTWGATAERQEALDRLAQARQAMATQTSQSPQKSQRPHSPELAKLHQEAAKQRKALDNARKDYATATPEAKALMNADILNQEKALEALLLQIRQKEKEERNKKQ